MNIIRKPFCFFLFFFFLSLTKLIVYKTLMNGSQWSFFFSTISQRCFVRWSFSQRSLKSCFILVPVTARFFFDINRRVLNYFTAIFLSFFQHKRQYLVHQSLRLPAKNVIRVWRNTEITEITEITSVNLKKAGMTSRHIVIEKQYTLFWISFAVVFGLSSRFWFFKFWLIKSLL